MSAVRASSHTRAADPRSPFVVDTRELGRRAGSMRRLERDVPAPAGWSLPLVEVPAGSPVHLDLRLEAVMDGVLVTGTAVAPVQAECGRCLDPVELDLTVDLQELFAYEPTGADDEQPLVAGDFLDLEELVRDAVVLGLPTTPVCSEECVGLCSTCGARLADTDGEHTHDHLDTRWSALAGLTTKTSETES